MLGKEKQGQMTSRIISGNLVTVRPQIFLHIFMVVCSFYFGAQSYDWSHSFHITGFDS